MVKCIQCYSVLFFFNTPVTVFVAHVCLLSVMVYHRSWCVQGIGDFAICSALGIDDDDDDDIQLTLQLSTLLPPKSGI